MFRECPKVVLFYILEGTIELSHNCLGFPLCGMPQITGVEKKDRGDMCRSGKFTACIHKREAVTEAHVATS